MDDFMTVSLWHNSTWYNANPKVPKLRSLRDFVHTMSDSITEKDDPEEAVFKEVYTSICDSAFPQVRCARRRHCWYRLSGSFCLVFCLIVCTRFFGTVLGLF